MLVCRKSSSIVASTRPAEPVSRGPGSQRFGEGGPVFLPRRKPSARTLQLLAAVADGEPTALPADGRTDGQ